MKIISKKILTDIITTEEVKFNSSNYDYSVSSNIDYKINLLLSNYCDSFFKEEDDAEDQYLAEKAEQRLDSFEISKAISHSDIWE